jgi:lipopolysaccharide export system permease protein
MRLPRILARYVAREVVIYTLVGLAAVSVVFVGQNLLRRLADLLMIGVSGADALTIVRCVVLVTLAYTVPISFLFGALVGIGRLAADVEIKAMRACGVGLAGIVAPVFALGFGVSCLTWYLALDVEHRVKRELRDSIVAMTASGRMITPQRFTQVRNRIFYVQSRDRENRLEGVFVADGSDPERPLLIFAESGDFSFDRATGTARLALRNGELHLDQTGAAGAAGTGGDGTYGRLSFERFEYTFAVPVTEVGVHWVRPRDMSNEDLRLNIARARRGEPTEQDLERYEVELHRRYALPVAPMIFALLAVPLSLGRGHGARAWGALLCAVLVAAFYAVLSFSQYLAMEAFVPAALAMWTPNVVFAAAALVLLARARRVPR